jgi:TonB family protein
VVSRGVLAGKADDRVVVRVQNEGEEIAVNRAGDSCTATLADGTQVPLKRLPEPDEKTVPAEIVVEPLHAVEVALSPPAPAKGKIVSIEIALQKLGRTVDVKDSYDPPYPLLTVPPVAPGRAPAPVSAAGQAATDPLGWEEATAALVVGADGRVASVTVLPDERGQRVRGQVADGIVAAARAWTFEPARRNGAAERSVVVRTFRFGSRKIVRRVFEAAARDLEPRLARYLHDAYPWVVDVTQAHGFAVAARPWKKKGIRGADAWLVRLGEASPGRTWVAVTSMTLLVRESPHGPSCECYWRAAQENGSRDFMDLLAAKLDLSAVEARELAPQDGALIPSGALEPDELGRWRRAAVRRLFEAPFSTILGKNKKRVALSGVLSRLEPNQPPPAAAEFLPATAGGGAAVDPVRVEGDVVPPVPTHRVSPVYSPEAKYERVQGRVFLEVTMDTVGNVTDLEIQRGIAGLNVSSVDAACCWKFKPATKNGQPVSVYYQVYLDYGLR